MLTLRVKPTGRIQYSYTVEIYRAHVPTQDKETGEQITIAVPVRRLLLQTNQAFGDSGHYKISARMERGEPTGYFSLSVARRIDQDPWNNPSHPGKCVAWFLPGSYDRLNPEPLTLEQVINWLVPRLGSTQRAQEAIATLLQSR